MQFLKVIKKIIITATVYHDHASTLYSSSSITYNRRVSLVYSSDTALLPRKLLILSEHCHVYMTVKMDKRQEPHIFLNMLFYELINGTQLLAQK